MLAVVLALLSSLAYGTSDFLGGRASRKAPLLSVLVTSQGLALLLLVMAVAVRAEGHPGAPYLLYGVLAGVSETVAIAALYQGLAVGVVSVVAGIGAAAPVVPVIAGILAGEVPSPYQFGGIALAVSGVALTTQSQPEVGEGGRSGLSASVLFGVLAALGFGSFYVAMDAASAGSVPWALLIARLTAVVLFVSFALVRHVRVAAARRQLPKVVAIGLLIVTADALYAVSSTLGFVAVVAVLSSLYPLVTIGLARVVLSERVSRLQGLGIAMCLAGAVTVAAG